MRALEMQQKHITKLLNKSLFRDLRQATEVILGESKTYYDMTVPEACEMIKELRQLTEQ